MFICFFLITTKMLYNIGNKKIYKGNNMNGTQLNYDFYINDSVLLEQVDDNISFGDIGEIVAINDDNTFDVSLEDDQVYTIEFNDILCIA